MCTRAPGHSQQPPHDPHPHSRARKLPNLPGLGLGGLGRLCSPLHKARPVHKALPSQGPPLHKALPLQGLPLHKARPLHKALLLQGLPLHKAHPFTRPSPSQGPPLARPIRPRPRPALPRPGPLLTCPQQDDLVVQGQLGEVRDPLGPLHQREELLVSGLADVGDGVVGLGRGAVVSTVP